MKRWFAMAGVVWCTLPRGASADEELDDAKAAIEAFVSALSQNLDVLSYCVVGGREVPPNGATGPINLPQGDTITSCDPGDRPGRGLICERAEEISEAPSQCSFEKYIHRQVELSPVVSAFLKYDSSMKLVAKVLVTRAAVGDHLHTVSETARGSCLTPWIKQKATFTMLFGYYQSQKVSASVPLTQDPATLGQFVGSVTGASDNYHAFFVGPNYMCVRRQHPHPLKCDGSDAGNDSTPPGGGSSDHP